jgi:hypothetical protein
MINIAAYVFNAFSKADLVLECVARTKSGSLEQQLRGAVRLRVFLVGLDAFQQFFDYRMARVDFEDLFLISVEVGGWVLRLG